MLFLSGVVVSRGEWNKLKFNPDEDNVLRSGGVLLGNILLYRTSDHGESRPIRTQLARDSLIRSPLP